MRPLLALIVMLSMWSWGLLLVEDMIMRGSSRTVRVLSPSASTDGGIDSGDVSDNNEGIPLVCVLCLLILMILLDGFSLFFFKS